MFPNAKMDIMCFAHVLRNVQKRPKEAKNNKSLIIDDIRKLQIAPNRKIFDMMSALSVKNGSQWKEILLSILENNDLVLIPTGSKELQTTHRPIMHLKVTMPS